MAGQKNFEVDQNATFTFIVEYKDNNNFYPKSEYDIMLTDSNANKIKLLEGYMTLSRSVTI